MVIDFVYSTPSMALEGMGFPGITGSNVLDNYALIVMKLLSNTQVSFSVFALMIHIGVIVNFAGFQGNPAGVKATYYLARISPTFWLALTAISFVLLQYYLLLHNTGTVKWKNIPIALAIFLTLILNIYTFLATAA